MTPTRAPRVANVIVGSWLFASTFVWPHTSSQMINLCVIGALSVVVALAAIR